MYTNGPSTTPFQVYFPNLLKPSTPCQQYKIIGSVDALIEVPTEMTDDDGAVPQTLLFEDSAVFKFKDK